jgi:hypothetical protein
VQASPPGLQAWITVATHDAARSPDGHLAHAERFVLQGVRAGRPMAYRVRALNRMGAGVCSDASEHVTTTGTAPGKCAKPAAVVKGSGMLEVSWTPPSDGGSDITGYQCQMAVGMPEEWVVVANVVADKARPKYAATAPTHTPRARTTHATSRASHHPRTRTLAHARTTLAYTTRTHRARAPRVRAGDEASRVRVRGLRPRLEGVPFLPPHGTVRALGCIAPQSSAPPRSDFRFTLLRWLGTQARNAFGDGPFSESSMGFRPKAVPPGAPHSPEARAINSRKVVLRWKPPTATTGRAAVRCAACRRGTHARSFVRSFGCVFVVPTVLGSVVCAAQCRSTSTSSSAPPQCRA